MWARAVFHFVNEERLGRGATLLVSHTGPLTADNMLQATRLHISLNGQSFSRQYPLLGVTYTNQVCIDHGGLKCDSLSTYFYHLKI